MALISRLPSGGGTKGKLNLFTQLNEPETKDGIWVKTENKYKKVVIDNHILNEGGIWGDIVSNLPNEFYYGDVVVYNGEIHLLGGTHTTNHYKWVGNEWLEVSTLPYNFKDGSALIYNEEIHILGGSESSYAHYKWNGVEWVKLATLPYSFDCGSAVVYNGEIHILGSDHSSSDYTKHYKFDGSEWSNVSTLPYAFYSASAVVYNGEIHILGSAQASSVFLKHYKWNGSEWISASTLPYNFMNGSSVVYNGEIHILGTSNGTNGTKHYKWNGVEWESVSTIPYNFQLGAALVKDNSIVIFGTQSSGYQTSWVTFTTPNNLYETNTLILQRGHERNGIYLTAIADTSIIEGECNRFVAGFDDVWFFGNGAFEMEAEIYYGDGTQWIKFKN